MPATRTKQSKATASSSSKPTKARSSASTSNPFGSSSRHSNPTATAKSKGGKPKKRTEKSKEQDRLLMDQVEKDLAYGGGLVKSLPLPKESDIKSTTPTTTTTITSHRNSLAGSTSGINPLRKTGGGGANELISDLQGLMGAP